ncbi:sulfite exporter TauE/SafE family protein [Allofrancisella frigidaquae]|uniref:Probable membrane transporter protein n=1 Tax=Allofrancisella frigidaquae TaxID=1085644 RepID=A0A6M3HSF1_9GAMM|nr:sulfite exporter TauE/SafE family protein [Allofrancisella frigidaquae]QIV94174.1 sulfite exporter TauE/SafE family protein [Allofrancisella frigidaquae]
MLIILGAVVGFVASFISTLLGGGAGLIATPAFYYIIVHVYGPSYAMQIALATCCGMSICLSLIATYKHQRKGNIQFGELRYYLIALAIGAVIGGLIVKHIDTILLKHIFSVILVLSGIWMILHNDSKIVKLPSKIAYPICGVCGVLSILATSTTFVTMFFIKMGVDIKKAISIASVCVVISSSIATVMLVYGINVDVPNTFGYLSIPLLLSAIPFSVVGSLLAVKYLGIISPRLLKMLFIALMFISAVVMVL